MTDTLPALLDREALAKGLGAEMETVKRKETKAL